MFWGMTLTPNRKYSQTCKQSFHISCAALDADESTKGETKLYVGNAQDRYLICTLQKNGPRQVMLDLNFMQGEEISFQSIGNGAVSLTGYFNDEYDMGDEEEEVEEEDDLVEGDLRNAINKKMNEKSKQAQVNPLDEDDSDSDDPDFEGMEDEDSDDLGEEEAADEDDDDDVEEDDDVDESEEEEQEQEKANPKKNKQNGEKLQRSNAADDDTEDEAMQPSKSKKMKLQNGEKAQNGTKNQKKEQQQQNKQQAAQQKQKQGGAEKALSGGVKVVDLREGTGPEAKVGKRAQVFYEGRLKSNNKVFDSMKSGAGFKFGVGRGEVIKGWDIGVAGMKVGGKRRITCPPHMAYGAKGAPPAIPPNSTLVFDVELKGVH